MPLYKHADFARECGISNAYLSVNKTRKRVIFTDDGLIDTANPINAAFMAKLQKKNANKLANKDATKEAPVVTPPDPRMEEILDLERQKKRLDLDKSRKEQAIMDAKLQKMHGVLIPKDVAAVAVRELFRVYTLEIKQGLDSLLSEIGKKARLNGNQVTEFRGMITRILNESMNRGAENSKKNIQKIVSEYASTKNAA